MHSSRTRLKATGRTVFHLTAKKTGHPQDVAEESHLDGPCVPDNPGDVRNIIESVGLQEREWAVLAARYGFAKHRTLQEVAEDFLVTRERVRQLEAKGLRKLNNHLPQIEAILSILE